MTDQLENNEKICGIIRPIAKMNDFYTFEHWNSVKDIMERAIQKAGYTPLTVSDSKGSTTIHSSIFLNLYQNEIVVCDVSNRNANVMFELGMRIAFDKPVVIIKDDKTPFSFDTSHIKHLEYPSDLRFQVIEKFIDDLANIIMETVEASKVDGYKSFLSHYAPIKVTTLEVNEVSEKIALESILKSINNLEERFNKIPIAMNNQYLSKEKPLSTLLFQLPENTNFQEILKTINYIRKMKNVSECNFDKDLGNKYLKVTLESDITPNNLKIFNDEIKLIISNIKEAP
ncbi:RNA helicase [Acinetobacter oleivorans]|uniref:RNA helicase n=1 Tax=Acinetobacter oleivorans TaxID=1148157 RepID=UPI0012507810|nr:RNA helicase [Acinetobacter oleivorans]